MVRQDSVSLDALGVARQIEQVVANGGRVQVDVQVDPRTKVWTVELRIVERVRIYKTKKGETNV